jgi:hypothetical protein
MARVGKYARTLNKAQQQALWKVFCRDHPYHEFAGLKYDGWNLIRRQRAYRAFRRKVQFASFDDCAMVPWAGMWLGIEKDGYTHS